MRTQYAQQFSRRELLRGWTLAGTAGLLSLHAGPVTAEPPPETTRLRLVWNVGAICVAPEYMAEALLQAEGFTEVQYVKKENLLAKQTALAAGEVDLTLHFSVPFLLQLEAGDPLVLLAGVHVGCMELFGTERVRAIRDLKGKTVAVSGLGAPDHAFLASVAAYIGLDPRTDLTWAIHPPAEAMQLLFEGQIDAFMAFPPVAQELREKQIGHVVVNSAVDRPWSQYFCCILAGHQEFVRQHPVATKRALRAILKAADICAFEPGRAAQFLVDKGYEHRYDSALQALKELSY